MEMKEEDRRGGRANMLGQTFCFLKFVSNNPSMTAAARSKSKRAARMACA